ncbi:MAG: ABC transporter permease [Clostridiales bacterium]|jgi:ABC-type uncharacterized transport system permease subunit|nr:ABC transporter permease [Clostridiales bacterium]
MPKKTKEKKPLAENRLLHTVLSIVIGFLVGALFLAVMGISVSQAYGKLFQSIFSGTKAISYCIVYAAPYIVAGLSVAFSFKTGVFNIGAEGQFVVGAMAACVVGILGASLPAILLVPLCFLAAALAGALWGAIVGFLKTKWGINEVLSMIMFNWIAFYLSNYIAGFPAIHSEGNAEATKNVAAHARILLSQNVIKSLDLCPTANWGILVAVALTVLVYFIIEKTTLGYELKAVGYNKHAAEYAGINVNRSILTSLSISGALGGIAGALLLLGMGGRISIFTSQEGYGFAGIVVALIGVTNPFGVFVAGLFYGAMTYGGSKLNLVGAPTQVVNIIMGTIVFFIAISTIFSYLGNLKLKKTAAPAANAAAGKEDNQK